MKRATYRPPTLSYRLRNAVRRHGLTVAAYATLASLAPLTWLALDLCLR